MLFAMIWIPLKTDLLKDINYADINPFSKKEVKVTEPKAITNTLPILSDTVATKVVIKNTIIEPVTAKLVKADTIAVAKSVNPDMKFHLVAGCFQVEENAVKFVQSLQSQNLNAAIIGQNNKGLYVVSCGDFATRKDALTELSTLRKVQPNAWLYRN